MVTVSSVEELDTRSMSLWTCLCDVLVTVGAHVLFEFPRGDTRSQNFFSARARIGLRCSVRGACGTALRMPYRSYVADARGRIQLQLKVAHPRARQCTGSRTRVPFARERLTFTLSNFGWEHGEGHGACSHPIGCGVRSPQRSQKVHPSKSRATMARAGKKFPSRPLLMVLRTCLRHESCLSLSGLSPLSVSRVPCRPSPALAALWAMAKG